MKQFRRHPFTLVEILIALGICAIGVCSIMVLFPIGASASRDAAMVGYASNAADQMLHFAKDCIMQEGSDGEAAFNQFTGWTYGNTSTYTDKTPQEPAPPSDSNAGTALATSSVFVEDMVNILNTSKNGTKVTAYANNVFLIEYLTDEYSDFSCFVSLYPRKVGLEAEDGGTAVLGAVSLRAEVSWPAQLPYEKRQKAEYSLDIFRPPEN